jgi:hypothetical protein
MRESPTFLGPSPLVAFEFGQVRRFIVHGVADQRVLEQQHYSQGTKKDVSRI